MKKPYEQLKKNLKKAVQERNFQKVVIGISGGLDSAVTLKLAVDALGPDKVTALIMPELGLTEQENIEHAKKLTEFFGVNSYYQPINSFLVSFNFVPWGQSPESQTNLRARIRMILLYHYANTAKALVLGTSNKSELLLGYGTKFGDLAADLEVIGNLFKSDVKDLAEHMGLPKEIIEKTPTAELQPGQTDEEDLGAPYAKLDMILRLYEEGRDEDEIISRGLDSALVQKTIRRIKENEHKGSMPPIIDAEVGHSEMSTPEPEPEEELEPVPEEIEEIEEPEIIENEPIIDEVEDEPEPVEEEEEEHAQETELPPVKAEVLPGQQALF